MLCTTMEARIRYAKTSDGASIAYAVIGNGPTLISVSNIWGDLHLYRSVPVYSLTFDAYANEGFQVVLYDTRGMGASDRSTGRYDLESRILDLDAIVEAIGEDTFSLNAIAAAVPTAVSYAAMNPERVSKLILANGYIRGSDWYEGVPAMRVTKELMNIAEHDWEMYTLTMANALMQFADTETAASMAIAFRSSGSPKEFLTYMEETLKTDLTDQLSRVAAPTLVMHLTPILPGTLPLMREIAAEIPDSQFVEVPVGPAWSGAVGHFLRGGGAGNVASAKPSAFRTILFTDLVGHTAMMRRLGDDRGRAVLREHEALTRDILRQFGGAEVKTMGDGFLASLPSVTRAVECAIALQKGFDARNATTDEPLQVRVGLNAGEPIEEDGDLFGETVILASRIAAMADGGEVLASTGVRELCAGKGFMFADLGEQAMRGFEDPVRVFEINWRDAVA